jgi:hypothetical protein
MYNEDTILGTEIRCKKCNILLADFEDIPNNIIWYSLLRTKLNGSCQNCGHKLPNPSKYAEKMIFEVKSSDLIIAK